MLNQSAVSPMGAIGVMQLLPSTGESLNVGNIHLLEPNIHAGAKYMSSLIYALSIEGDLTDMERNFFAVAAYNAGPNNIRKARALSSTMGFDPNKWFENVEMATAKLFGVETFLYVRNVYKYYVSYDIEQRHISISQENLESKEEMAQ
jgi:membrane-bound lytic murein transglycosylase MltF